MALSTSNERPFVLTPPLSLALHLPYMVQIYFRTVNQTEFFNTLKDLSDYGPDHIKFNVVPATQTNANHFILHVLSIADSEIHQISTWHVID